MKEEVIDGKRVWTFNLKEFVGNDPLAQIDYEREMEWRKMLREGKTREEIEEYMSTTDYEERRGERRYCTQTVKKKELEQRIPIFRLLGISNCKGKDCGLSTDGKCGNAKIDGKNIYRRVFIKRIGWEYYQGKDEDGELWEVELDNCDEDDYEWYFQKCTNETEILNNKKQ